MSTRVDEKLVQSWLDIVAKYMTFALRFPRSPATALKAYSGRGAIDPDLVAFGVAGIGLAYLLVLAIAPKELADDRSEIVQWLRKTDLTLIPPVVLLATLATAIYVHVATKGLMRLGTSTTQDVTWRAGAVLRGTLEDTVNAALGFAAFMVPGAVLWFLVVMHWTLHNVAAMGPNIAYLVGVFGLLIGVASIVLACLALAAVHPLTTSWNAFWAVCSAGTLATFAAFAFG